MPRVSEVFADVRGDDRTMRISLHRDRNRDPSTVVVSLWLGPLCRGSFRMAPDDLDRMIATLAEMTTAIHSVPSARGSAHPVTAARGSAAVATVGEPTADGPADGAMPGFGFGLPTAAAVAGDPVDPAAGQPEDDEVTGTVVDTHRMPSVPNLRVA